MTGYCDECDKQVEFNQRSVVKSYDDKGNLYVIFQCPRCEDYEKILLEEAE